jgi:hypothetical protein
MNIHVRQDRIEISNLSPADLQVTVYGKVYPVEKGKKVQIDNSK